MKTTFRRHLALILCILLGATILLGVSFWALFSRDVTETEKGSLRSTANSVGGLIEAYSAAYLSDWSFRTNLAVAADASENDILICDAEGTVRLCSEGIQTCEHLGRSIGEETAELLFQNCSVNLSEAASALYGDERLAVALPVALEDGEPLCIILVSMPRSQLTALTDKTLQIFSMVALVVFVAALIAAPYLARRETRPIREMAAAAKQIAHGDYTVRVPTDYQNEEIEEMAVAFNNMTVALQNSEQVHQEFVANVSHELKTPMTTIAGYMDGMLDGTIPKEKYGYYMNLVSTEVRRLSRLVRNMLDISRLRDQGVPKEQLVDFDICDAAGQALLSFEQRINRKKLNVDIDLPDLGVLVRALPDAVTQVLYNLMDNAVKFADEGGTLSVSVRPEGGKAAVTVGNTGPTIPAEELPLIFDRFHKTDKSRSSDRDGAGLGLYIVKTIVLAHGEDIYVTSRDGKTEVTFTMPLSK